MSQHATELCALLVNEVYGELCFQVFRVLLRHGRLSLRPLVHHSQLSVRQLKHGLAVLIQQHLVRHYTEQDDVTFYEADWKAAYALIRSGKVLILTEQQFGSSAAELVSNLLLQGHTTTKDLARAYQAASLPGSKKTGGITADVGIETKASEPAPENSTSNDSEGGQLTDLRLIQLNETLRKLLEDGLVSTVWIDQFRPFTDNYNEAVRAVKRLGFSDGTKGSKANLIFERQIKGFLRNWRNREHERENSKHTSHGTKRQLDDVGGEPDAKRTKTDVFSTTATGLCESASGINRTFLPLQEDLVVRVNFEKYSVLSRNQRLAEFAEQKMGSVPSVIYAELLHNLSQKIPRCQDEPRVDDEEDADADVNCSTTTLELALTLPPEVELANTIGKARADQIEVEGPALHNGRGHLQKTNADEVDENGNIPEVIHDTDEELCNKSYGESEEGSALRPSKTRIDEIIAHLKLLKQNPHRFVKHVGTHGRGEWAVDFQRLMKELKQAELEGIVSERFGVIALRLVRILSDKGKLDEKQISNMALVKQKDIRVTLTAMHEAGYLELQEVPRDNSRNASRTMFLWFFDPERCRRLVVEDIYKTMSRLLQRAASERAEMKYLLSKAERTDVVGHEDRYLQREERRLLKAWRDKEERLLGQIMRLDRQVELFRDF